MSDDDVSKAAALSREIMSDIAATQEKQAGKVAVRRRVRDGARIRQAASVVVIVIFVGLTALNVAGRLPFGQTATKPASDAERMMHLRRTLNYAVRAIEAYRKVHGEWPASLSVVGAPSDVPLNYVLNHNGGYSIAVTDGALTANYDSSQDPETAFGDLRHP